MAHKTMEHGKGEAETETDPAES